MANYLPIIRGFLDDQFGGKTLNFDELRGVDVHRFLVRRVRAGSRGRAKLVVSALRSFLRFLQQRGLLAADLAAAVPGVAGCRLAHLPKALPAGSCPARPFCSEPKISMSRACITPPSAGR